jgi:hypothetical protein
MRHLYRERRVLKEEGGIPMPQISIQNALLLIPLAIALAFFLWVLWNLTRELDGHGRRRF